MLERDGAVPADEDQKLMYSFAHFFGHCYIHVRIKYKCTSTCTCSSWLHVCTCTIYMLICHMLLRLLDAIFHYLNCSVEIEDFSAIEAIVHIHVHVYVGAVVNYMYM